MCGRIAQYRPKTEYAHELGWTAPSAPNDSRTGRYNVPPGSSPWLMHRRGDEREHMDPVHWGYRPSWAAEKGVSMAINARIEKAATGRYFRHMWKSGRAIVPADGWYEWTRPAGKKQPWHIRLKTERPMFLAAITNFEPGKEPDAGSGFVIVTAAADAGLVDVHDRRPVVFAPEDAQLWLDPALPLEQAEMLARSVAVPADAFEWYEVSTGVNKAGNNDPAFVRPLFRGT
jgi:putative SOS response-associated peptidase YedK